LQVPPITQLRVTAKGSRRTRSNLGRRVGGATESVLELSAKEMNLKAYGFVGLPQRTLGIGPLKAKRMADPKMCGIKEAGVATPSGSSLEVVERRKLREGRGRETAGVIQAAGLGKRETDNLNLNLALIAGVGVLAEFLPLNERQAQYQTWRQGDVDRMDFHRRHLGSPAGRAGCGR